MTLGGGTQIIVSWGTLCATLVFVLREVRKDYKALKLKIDTNHQEILNKLDEKLSTSQCAICKANEKEMRDREQAAAREAREEQWDADYKRRLL